MVWGSGIGIGFNLSASYLYGLPLRAARTFPLVNTSLYRFYNWDRFNHPYGTLDPIYGSWPYLTGHSPSTDASIVWMNASETFVKIYESLTQAKKGSRRADFISVGGKFEFFMFASSKGPKQHHTLQSTLSGFPPMPSAHSLGFHYSKWEWNSAQLLT